jgi:uncharacterized protein
LSPDDDRQDSTFTGEETMQNNKTLILTSAIIISLGIFGAGFSIGKAVYLSKILNREVTVKGMAERDVKSDLAMWEIGYREIGNNLTELNQRLQHDQGVVTAFLKEHAFTDQEIEVQSVKVEDRLANVYSQSTGDQNAAQRYIVTGGLHIRSARVSLIQQVSQLTGTLLQQGVPLAFDSNTGNPNPSYYFTQLDTVRPSMLADATRSARLVAEQFAKDSGTRLGGIQHASQGIFQIMGRDTSTLSSDWNSNQSALGSIDKKVRLVTTIDYRLK